MNKSDLRLKIKENINALSAEYKQNADRLIAENVISSDAFKKSKSIFIYVSTANEPDTYSIIKTALKNGKNVYVPKCIDKSNMIAVRINKLDELTIGKYGIPEPIGTQIINADKIDLAIIPCISASPDGKRLGHGAGYYDRFLQKSDCFKLCLCYKALLSNDIPMDTHDIYMDNIITE